MPLATIRHRRRRCAPISAGPCTAPAHGRFKRINVGAAGGASADSSGHLARRDVQRRGQRGRAAPLVGRSFRRHRHQEVLRFLREVDKAVPPEQDIHIVLDNYATHKHGKVRRVAEAEQARPPALHAHQLVVAEPRRALLRAALRAAPAARSLHFGVPLGEEPQAVSGHLQREPAAAGVDEVDRGNPRKGRPGQGETSGSL